MNELLEIDNASIRGTVRDILDEILDCVVAQTNRIEQLRSLAQQVVDEMIREAIDARDGQSSGAGDVERLRPLQIQNQQVLQTEQRQIIEGQLIGQPALQHVLSSQHVTSHLNRSRSLTLLSTCFKSDKVEPSGIKPSPSSRALSACSFNHEHRGADGTSNSLFSQSDELSRSTDYIDASNISEDNREYPRCAKMKTVTTARGEIQVPAYCFDDMAEIELDVLASKEILTDTDIKKETMKKRGLFSRMGKFFRKMCCCTAREDGCD